MRHRPALPARRLWLQTSALWGAGLAGLAAGCSTAKPAAAPTPAAASAAPPAAVNTDPRTPPLTLPEPANPALPSLLLIGDSTVRNGRDDGQRLGPVGQWGWGHVLARYLDATRLNTVNRAIGGLSSRTYRTGGHWARTKAFIKAGDVVLIQFGHNDSGPINDTQRARGTLRGTGPEQETIDNQLTGQRETVLTYGAYLRGYIEEIRALGARPVLCTPIPRKRRDEQGRTERGTAAHAGWATAVARETGVPLIDLDTLVSERYDALGPVVVDMLFPRTTPEERVHPNWAGSALNAQLVLQALRAQQLLPEAAFLPPPAAAPADNNTPAAAPLNPRLPTLFLVGDSTVRSAGQNGHWGWGERLAPWLDAQQIQLANHAIGGRSTRTFLREGRWARVRAQFKPGDVVLIQFGHNDVARVGDPAGKQRGSLPGTGPERQAETLPDGTVEPVQSFGAYLTRYVREALDAGVVPVVLSPIPHKDRWQEGRDFPEHAAWGREVAEREGALFVDLTMRVTARYQQIGAAAVEGLFSDARTHTNDAGAKLNAECVAEILRGLPQALLAPAIKASAG
ncbi:rhamnogalacturonan acetylesterase [Rubrivivax rivuli]|uniref:Rhamnogalacturonan acetylesterase n=1 Tax=Rubrivivax rivuli TaxID=1862385 RepID=A0A437RB12_9BURK|nr:rhamnogalacturonan acetylesterase [Rubrivivax rivuli]RVU43912.1 rhamnogalacturonan acetylesterase [Rubrivivax rivuli]